MAKALIFGGTFNPVHVGHLRSAIEVSEVLDFQRVDWVPSYAPYHKTEQPLLGFDLRVALLRAALNGHERFHVNDIEKRLPVPSITIQTLEAMAEAEPSVERYFLLGDREFLRLHKWRRAREVVGLTHVVIGCRTEFDFDEFASAVEAAWPQSRRVSPAAGALMAFELTPGRNAVVVPLPRIEISSSFVRSRWLEGRSLSQLVPDGVVELLEQNRVAVETAWRAGKAPDFTAQQG